jgi:hypothetical protein
MPYQIDRFNGTPLVTVDDGTIDQTTDIKLVGKNYAGYGEIQNENYLFLLENFSNTTAPPKAVSGQIWYDSSSKKLKFYDNTKWRTTGGAEIGATAPTGLTVGDFWYNTDTDQLYAWNGAEFILVGPLAVAGQGQTNFETASVVDTLSNTHAIIKAIVDGDIIFIISTDSFTLKDEVNPITGFSYINQGITLVDSPTGSTSTLHRLWGTASDSDKLGGIDGANYVLADAAVFTALASFDDAGFTVGSDNDLKVFVDGGTTVTIQNQITNKISFKILDGITTKETIRIEGDTVVPGVTASYDLGSTALKWRNMYAGDVYATTFHGAMSGALTGTASQADTLLFNAGYRSATNTNVGNSIVARDASGNFSANVIDATTTKARYADLAEIYEADADYEPGTVVVFGGENEITVTTTVADSRVAGVISTDPAYIMNSEGAGLPVALRGKVPVKVKGSVIKGDILVTSDIAGYAEVNNSASAAAIIAKALENKADEGLGTVIAVVV